jgi:gamma-glutamylaminecyclotransferase
MLLFVYGTLCNRMHNHWLLEGEEYIGSFQTKDKFYMVTTASRSFPYVSRYQLISNTSPTHISGELYFVRDETIRNIDKLEGHPEIYTRVPIELDNYVSNTMAYIIESPELIRDIRGANRFVPVVGGDWVLMHDER